MPSMALMQAAATASRKVTPYPGRVTPGRAKYAERGGGGGRGLNSVRGPNGGVHAEVV